MRKFTKGFTLIELLIVIALLGILAVGLLAALDPFEQLKKGSDTSVRNTVSEFQGAVIRYYAVKSMMPWCSSTVTDCSAYEDSLGNTFANKTVDTLSGTTTNVINTGELKADFTTLAGSTTLQRMIAFGSISDATIEVCFKPASKSITNDPNTKYQPLTGVSGCTSTGVPTTNSCLWCVK